MTASVFSIDPTINSTLQKQNNFCNNLLTDYSGNVWKNAEEANFDDSMSKKMKKIQLAENLNVTTLKEIHNEAHISELIETFSDQNNKFFDKKVLFNSTEKMFFQFPVLAEDWRDNSQQNLINSKIPTKVLNRKITVVSDCIWKSNDNLAKSLSNSFQQNSIDEGGSSIKTVKTLKKKTKKKFFFEKNLSETVSLTNNTKLPNTSSVKHNQSGSPFGLSLLTMDQSIPGDSANCDCTSMAWAQLRKSKLAVSRKSRLRLQNKLKLGEQENDDDSYRKCTNSKDLTPLDAENIFLNPPISTESTSFDSGVPSSLSSFSSASENSTQSNLTLNGNFCMQTEILSNNIFHTGSACLLSPDKLPTPQFSTNLNIHRYLENGNKLSNLLSNVMRKMFDIPRKSISNENNALNFTPLVLNLNNGEYSPKWRGDDANEASPLTSFSFSKNERNFNKEFLPKNENTSNNSVTPTATNSAPMPTTTSVSSFPTRPTSTKTELDSQKILDYQKNNNVKTTTENAPNLTRTNVHGDNGTEVKTFPVGVSSRFDKSIHDNAIVSTSSPIVPATTLPHLQLSNGRHISTKYYDLETNNNVVKKSNNKSLIPTVNANFADNTFRSSTPQLKNSIAGKLANMKRFHYPAGVPVSREDNDIIRENVRQFFEAHPRGQVEFSEFGTLCATINFPIYTKRALYDACCSLNNLPVVEKTENVIDVKASTSAFDLCGPINFAQFCVFWNKMTARAHDSASRFVFTLASARSSIINNNNNNIINRKGFLESENSYITKADFMPIMMDIINCHPGLHFLKASPQFHSRYCEVVIVRIFWNVNRSWTGRITAEELKRSNFLQIFQLLEEATDINKVTEYFSYEHFYVTYCKFWEIDTDHDMIISRDDMREHCGGALTDQIIDRIFSAAVIRTLPTERVHCAPGPVRQQPIETIGFEDFVAFLLAEEDKRHPTSIEYWFRCIDLDGDGMISLYEMEYFYAEIEQKLLARNMDTLSLTDVICNLLDSVSPKNSNYVTRADLKRCGLAHRFFNTFVNYIKYLDQESSEGERAFVKTVGDREMTDWETFCAFEYELLMVETEVGSADGYVDDIIDVVLDDDEHDEDMNATLAILATEEALTLSTKK